jgi:hypothetical protein
LFGTQAASVQSPTFALQSAAVAHSLSSPNAIPSASHFSSFFSVHLNSPGMHVKQTFVARPNWQCFSLVQLDIDSITPSALH